MTEKELEALFDKHSGDGWNEDAQLMASYQFIEAVRELAGLDSSEAICEALVRHLETTGSEVLEKNFIQDGKIIVSVWAMIGPNAQIFNEGVRQWLADNGFKGD